MASIAGVILGFPTRTIIAAVLGPAGYGIVGVADLIQRYSAYTDLGMKTVLSRQVPLLIGRGEEEESRQVASITFTWLLLMSVAVVAVLWFLYLSGATLKGLLTLPNLIVISFIVFLERLNAFNHNYAKGYGLFDAIGMNYLLHSTFSPVSSMILVLVLNIPGFLIARMATSALQSLVYLRLMVRETKFHPRLALPFRPTAYLLKLGAILYATSLSEGFMQTIILSIVAVFVSSEALGQITYAMGVILFATGIADGLNIVISKRIMEHRGTQGEKAVYAQFRPYMETPFIMYILLVTISTGISYFGYMALIRVFLKDFAPALPVAQILVFGQFFASMSVFFRIYYNATDQLLSRMALAWVVLIFNAALTTVALVLGYGIIGAAVASSIGYCIYAFMLVILSAHQIYGSLFTGLIFFMKLVILSSVMTGWLVLLSWWQPSAPAAPMIVGWGFEFCIAGLRLGAFIAFALVLYSLFFWNYRVDREIAGTIQQIVLMFRQRVFHVRPTSHARSPVR